MNNLEISVLDKGYVDLLNHTDQGDLLVVNAARCSFDKQHEELDEDKDEKLIKYLAKHGHLLPFRHPSVTLRIHAPLFVLRQLGKHQVGFSWSEVSRRYITGEPEFYEPGVWRKRPEDNIKQGSGGALSLQTQEVWKDKSIAVNSNALEAYHNFLDHGVAPEMARMMLPQSMYTTTVTTGTLLGWYNLYKLRMEEHTQLETQDYAEAIGDILEECFPMSWGALCEYSE